MSVQKFQIGDRVQRDNDDPFVIADIRMRSDQIEYSGYGRIWYWEDQLSLAPERPAYVASDRKVLGRTPYPIARCLADQFRCESDDEMAERHAVERAVYDAKGDGA